MNAVVSTARRWLVIPAVLEQHVAEAAHLSAIRASQVIAPNMDLYHLSELDERIESHVDALLVAGEAAWPLIEQSLDPVSAGVLFAATVMAIETQNTERLHRLIALAESVPEARDGLLTAFGWVSGPRLQGIGSALLASSRAFDRFVGLSACAMHRMDPGPLLIHALNSPDLLLRARAFRAAGELGRRELLSVCAAGTRDADAACRFWAAWSAALLGETNTAIDALSQMSLSDGPYAERALELAVLAMEAPRAQAMLGELARDPRNSRRIIRGCGLIGDPAHVPWLIENMKVEALARIAGEALSMITGMDLEALDLDGEPVEAADAGPSDNPDEDYVAMDPDEDLPWPDAAKVLLWWQSHTTQFAKGTRVFMGAALTPQSCRDVLRDGYQHQRRVAALHLALLSSSGTLFEWRAPAWRQLRKLA